MEEKLRTAIIEELQRQSEEDGGPEVRVEEDRLVVNGSVDLDSLVMAVVGSVAGGP
ncbi:hypothetical protein [Rubellimicrobium roseum]|uniref:hypothetical protein n=1 Tax=Rubellimicrobium roseum TaxID=687525 RepID=UPI00159B9519|nr:hypothetical protein [Rubellimicrobium roseum]